MTVKMHLYVDNEFIFNGIVGHCPRNGDTVRYGAPGHDQYAKVTEVIWCLNEDSSAGQRVNVRCESPKEF